MANDKLRNWRMAVLAILLSCGFGTVDAQAASLEEILSSPELLEQALIEGEEAAFLCDYCHGAAGSSVKPNIPNIASQNARYMLDQFTRYQSGDRFDFTGVMKGLVDQLSVDEQIAVAVYYANQPLLPPEVEPTAEQRARGKQIYETYCHACHGTEGRGGDGYPRIAGQQPLYIAEILKLFRDGSGGLSRDRHSEAMQGIATLLDDEDIDALSMYIASMY